MRTLSRFLLFLMLSAAASAQVSASSAPVVPSLVNFNGVIHDADAKPLAGVFGVTFALYKESQGGPALWIETQNVQSDKNGHYSVALGSTTSEGLRSDLFAAGEARWLGVQIQGQEEQPRMLLLSVPYAMKAADAQTLGGLPSSAYMLNPTRPAAGSMHPTAVANSPSTVASVPPPTSSNVTTTGGTAHSLPMFTTGTNIQNSVMTQTGTTAIDVHGSLGVNTTGPAESLDVSNGNAVVRGVGNFLKLGQTATLYIGDVQHPIEAAYSNGLSIGAFKAPKAIFIADFTGNVGIGTTMPKIGILNTAANNSVVVGLSTLGWTAPANSGKAGTDAIHGTGGSADPNGSGSGGAGAVLLGGAANIGPEVGSSAGGSGATLTGGVGLNGGAGVVATGGAGGNFGLGAGGGGAGVVATGGNTLGDFGGGDGVDANGVGGGTGLIATAGTSIDQGSAPGVAGTGGFSAQNDFVSVANGPGLVGRGGSGTVNGWTNPGGDGIDAIAGTGCSGCANGLAGSFTGDVNISGNLNVSGTKAFRIDHPLDPANKYLYHAALESSEVLNLYSGNATLDINGEATVQLPNWLEALNRDFRYQLTAVGAAAPNLHIAQKIQNNSFRIGGGIPGLEVSWQVTGVRQDAWHKAHPMIVEAQKPPMERGYYINPELFGAPPERNMDWARMPDVMKRLIATEEKQAQQRANRKQARLTRPAKLVQRQ